MATYFFCNIIPSRTQSSQSPKINIKFLREDIGPSTNSITLNIVSFHRVPCCTWPSTLYMFVFTARFYAERGYATVSRLSVRPSVALKYDFHIGWNTWKIISRPNSLRPMCLVASTWAIWCNGNAPKFRVEWGWGQEHIKRVVAPKRCKIGL